MTGEFLAKQNELSHSHLLSWHNNAHTYGRNVLQSRHTINNDLQLLTRYLEVDRGSE